MPPQLGVILLILLLSLHATFSDGAANQTMHTSGTNLPYVVHLPLSTVSPPYPTVIFMHGSGCAGAASTLSTNAFCDGVGVLCRMYDSGNKTGAQKMAVENYLLILPVCAPSYCQGDQRQWEPLDILQVLNAVIAEYPVDKNRITVSGYSMGGKSTWVTAIQSPTTFSSLITSAGYDEFNSSLSALTSNFIKPLVTAGITFQTFVGSADVKQPLNPDDQPVLTILKDLDANYQETTIQGADHSAMSTAPYLLESLWEWVAKQSRDGTTSNSVTAGSASGSESGGSTKGEGTGSSSRISAALSTSVPAPSQSPLAQQPASASPASATSPSLFSPAPSADTTESTSFLQSHETLVFGAIAIVLLLALFLVFFLAYRRGEKEKSYEKVHPDTEDESGSESSDK